MSATLVVITADGLEHRYVTNRLCSEFEVAAILVTDAPPRRSWKKVLKSSVTRFADKALWRIYLKAIGDERARARDLRRVFGASCERFDLAGKVRSVGRPKAGELLQAVTSIAPDYLAIYGTGIIPDAVLKAARIKAFNMHTGISPHYRGTSCAFWPIYHGEPGLVGATVHECTSDVDGGEIYFTGRADLHRRDSLHTIFARAVTVGAEGYVGVLRSALAGQLRGHVQNLAEGREFKGNMRGIRAELLARIRLRLLRRRWRREEITRA